jgi:hypothetical protein
MKTANDFSYDQVFDDLLLILQDKLTAEGKSVEVGKLINDNKSKIIACAKKALAENAVKTEKLEEDIAIFATSLFLQKNFALIINRYFVNELDDMEDVALIIQNADFSLIKPTIIAFIYRNVGHFMSVVINVDSGIIRFTNSSYGNGDFANQSKSLLSFLITKFGKQFEITETLESEKLLQQQGDNTTCNFHSMLNNIIWVLKARGQDMVYISDVISKIFGADINAENIEDLIRQCANNFKSEEQKVNLQQRMILAAGIYREVVDKIYEKSQHNKNMQALIDKKGKYNAFLSEVTTALERENPCYQQVAILIAKINNNKLDLVLNNNFSLNPDLVLGECDLEQLLFDNERTIEMLSNIKDVDHLTIEIIRETFEIIAESYREIGAEQIGSKNIQDTVDKIKKGKSISALPQYYKRPAQERPVQDQQYRNDVIVPIRQDTEDLYNLEDHDLLKAIVESCKDCDSESALKAVMDLKLEQSALHIAAAANDCEMIKRLAEIGFSFDTTDEYGYNALDALLSIGEDNIKTVEVLLDKGININAESEFHDSSFHIACANSSNPKLFKLLIAKGANINLQNYYNETGLELLIQEIYNAEQDLVKDSDFESIKVIIESEGFIAEKKCLEKLEKLKVEISKEFQKSVMDIIDIFKQKLDQNGKRSRPEGRDPNETPSAIVQDPQEAPLKRLAIG